MSCEAGCWRIRCGGMLQHFFKLMFRAAEREPVQAESRHRGPRTDEARHASRRPTTEFLAQVLKSALAQKHAESRGARAVHQSPKQPSSKPASRDAEQPG